MDPLVQGSASPAGPPAPPPHRRWGPGGMLTLVNGVLAGVGSVYATTQSVTITVVAAFMAITIAAMLVARR